MRAEWRDGAEKVRPLMSESMESSEARMAGWRRKCSAPKRKRDESMESSESQWRDGAEKGRPLREKREYRREKRAERDKHDQDERV